VSKKNVEVLIPDNYSDVTVRQYKKMLEGWNGVDDPKEAALAAVSALCDIDRKQLNHANWKDLSKVIEKLGWLLKEPDPLALALPLQNTFTMKGVEYGFIPNWTKLTVGEFADLETYCSKSLFDNLEKALAVLYRPIEKKKVDSYRIEAYSPHHKKQENMLDCTMDIVIGAVVFFYRIGKRLAIDSRLYSLQQKKKK
tara:strand:- start:574 stop:1164 length:591 start_codon:yes stop_codon:yes gene_type:complete